MSFSASAIKNLNRAMRSNQDVQLGTFLSKLHDFTSGSGNMALQSASAVSITGGTITGVVISGSISTADYANESGSALNYTVGGGIDTAINLRISASTLALHTNATGSNVHGLGTISTQNANSISASGSFTGTIISASAKFGTGNDYTYFEADGTMGMSGSATVWDDMMFPLTTAKQGQTDKPPFDPNEVAYMFPSGDTTHIMYIIAQLKHSYKIGSTIDPHVHWKQTQSGSPVFKMDYKWYDNGAQVPATFTTYTMANRVYPYTSGSLAQMSYNPTGISGSHITDVSSMLLIKLYRDDSAYAGAVSTNQFDLHIMSDSLGSRTEFVK